ncbi:MAG: lamin tail domain-containing protein [Muribaculaceae bacterium]|nr:lamin tail domain-containing protein [Muribaculaceae bacterium]
MKTIKLLFVALLAVAMTACVEDKVYEGPNTIEAVSINPDAPTSFDEVVVTAKVSGLLNVTKAVLRYSINDDFVEEINMTGDGKTFTATIPAQEDGDKVNFSVIITNEAGYTSTVDKDYTVGDKPSDFTKLVINEVFGAGNDNEKYLELYNNGEDPIKLKGVVIRKDEADNVWVGEEGEVIMGHGYFCIVGAKGVLGEGGSGPNPRPMTKGLSAKKNVLMEVYDPNGNLVTKFQRGIKGDEGWGNGSSYNGLSYTENKKTWSRCPNGSGNFMIAEKSLGAKNPDSGEEDLTIVQ